MNFPAGKKVVCITGTVWTGRRRAPRHLLVKEGFVRPTWFSTRVAITDAEYKKISTSVYHLALSKQEILIHIKYGSDYIGIMNDSFLKALETSSLGVLVVGPPEIAEKLLQKNPDTTIFALKASNMELSSHLNEASQQGRLHRIDIDTQQVGAWDNVYNIIRETLNLC